jgi:hypothetical protein
MRRSEEPLIPVRKQTTTRMFSANGSQKADPLPAGAKIGALRAAMKIEPLATPPAQRDNRLKK